MYETESITEDQEKEILEEAAKRFEACDSYFSDLYSAGQADLRFVHGEGQWDESAKSVRDKDGRPTLTLNQCKPYYDQVVNDVKQARIAVRFVPIDGEADVDTAEVRAGVVRNIEKQSDASTVYGTAVMNSVGAGLGWIRIKTEYADNDTFEQEAFIERVLDFTSIMLDPHSMELDGSDAEYGFVRVTYTKEEFEELYPEAECSSFSDINTKSFTDEEEVTLVEYFYVEKTTKELHEVKAFVGGEVVSLYADNSDLKRLKGEGIEYEKLRSREVEEKEVYHCVLSGKDVLSRERFPASYIPLVPVYGVEFYDNGKREFHSLIRQAKDAQRMYNYLLSENVGIMALQPRAPHIAPVGSFRSHPDKWANANNENFSTLEYDVVVDDETGQILPPPMRQPPPQGSAALMQEATRARDDIRLAMGMSSANMGQQGNVISGIALKTNQIEGDNATFHFIDNLSTSIRQAGRILNELIPVIYSTRTIARIVGEDGAEDTVPVNTPFVKDESGMRVARAGEQPMGIHDLSVGKYDVDVDVGASYSSKRQEIADKMVEIANVRPEIMDIAGDLFFEALDMPMSRQIAERIKAQMNPALLGDDPEATRLQEAANMVKQMEDQLKNYEAALAEKESNKEFEQTAKTLELNMEQQRLNIEVEEKKAEIAKIYADIQKTKADTTGQQQQNINALVEQIEDLRESVSLILDDVELDIIENEQVTSEPVIPEENTQEETRND